MFACFTSYLTCHYISCHSTVTYWHIRLHISREQPPFLPCWCLRNSKAGALLAIETAQPGVQFYSTEPSIHGRHFDSYIFIHLPSGRHSWLEYPGMKPIGYIHLHGDFCPAIYVILYRSVHPFVSIFGKLHGWSLDLLHIDLLLLSALKRFCTRTNHENPTSWFQILDMTGYHSGMYHCKQLIRMFFCLTIGREHLP